jgi:hypothetical protein
MTLTAPDETPSSSRFWVGFAAGAGVMLAVVLAVVLFTRGASSPAAVSPSAHLAFGATEQAYAPQIHISDLKLSHSTNMANQELIYVVGNVANTGTRAVRGIEVTVEFQDSIRQLVLRDTAPLFPPAAEPLAPGASRSFQLTFEHVPPSWNHEPPVIRVTGLALP